MQLTPKLFSNALSFYFSVDIFRITICEFIEYYSISKQTRIILFNGSSRINNWYITNLLLFSVSGIASIYFCDCLIKDLKN